MPCVNCRSQNKAMPHPKATDIEVDKFLTTLGLDKKEWTIGFQYIYRDRKFHFYLLLKNLKDDSLNTSIFLGSS